MRPTCLACARKHLAQAVILGIEAATGYPTFKWLVIGHMAEAEAELVTEYPDLANEIREYRKEYESDMTCGLPLMSLIEQATKLDDALKDAEEAKKAGRRRK